MYKQYSACVIFFMNVFCLFGMYLIAKAQMKMQCYLAKKLNTPARSYQTAEQKDFLRC